MKIRQECKHPQCTKRAKTQWNGYCGKHRIKNVVKEIMKDYKETFKELENK